MHDESQLVVHIGLDLFWASKVKQLKLLVFNILKALGSDLEKMFFFVLVRSMNFPSIA